MNKPELQNIWLKQRNNLHCFKLLYTIIETYSEKERCSKKQRTMHDDNVTLKRVIKTIHTSFYYYLTKTTTKYVSKMLFFLQNTWFMKIIIKVVTMTTAVIWRYWCWMIISFSWNGMKVYASRQQMSKKNKRISWSSHRHNLDVKNSHYQFLPLNSST